MLYNLKRCYTATIGTGTLTIGAAILNDFSDIPDGTTVSYSIIQGSLSAGFDAEVGRGTYSAGTLARDTVLSSTNGGAKITLDGTAQVVVTALAEDFVSFSGGVAGQVATWSSTDTITAGALIPPATNILTLTNAAASTLALNITAAKTLTLTAADNYTLTVPATGTAALLGIANVFTAAQTINVNSTSAFFVEQDGVKDSVFRIDTTNARVILSNNTPIRGLNTVGSEVNMILYDVSNNLQFGNASSVADLVFAGSSSARFTIGASERFRIDNVAVYPRTALTLGSASNIWSTFYGRNAIMAGNADVVQLQVTGHTTQTNPVAYLIDNTATTNAVRNVLKLETQSTGTAANGLGAGLLFTVETATAGTIQNAGRVYTVTTDATNASRKYALVGTAFDTAEREGWRVEADGSAAKIGLYGVATVARATTAGTASTFAANTSGIVDDTATFDSYTIGQIVKALRDIGILT